MLVNELRLDVEHDSLPSVDDARDNIESRGVSAIMSDDPASPLDHSAPELMRVLEFILSLPPLSLGNGISSE